MFFDMSMKNITINSSIIYSTIEEKSFIGFFAIFVNYAFIHVELTVFPVHNRV